MATGTGGSGARTASGGSIERADSDEASRSAATVAREGETEASFEDGVDLEFEWFQLCHGCGERKWFTALICESCRRRHGI